MTPLQSGSKIQATRRRLDHQPYYLVMLSFLAIAALIVLSHVVAGHALHARLATGVTDVMAAVLLLGCVTGLFSAASGTRRFRPDTDIRDSYTIASWALIGMVVPSLIVFCIGVLLHNPPPLEVAVLLAGNVVGLGWKAYDLNRTARRLTGELVHHVTERLAGA